MTASNKALHQTAIPLRSTAVGEFGRCQTFGSFHKTTNEPYADKGYISKELFEKLFVRNIELITKVKKNMKNRLISEFDKCMSRKRALIESVNDQLQNISMIEHTRHRNLWNF